MGDCWRGAAGRVWPPESDPSVSSAQASPDAPTATPPRRASPHLRWTCMAPEITLQADSRDGEINLVHPRARLQ